MSKLGSPPLPLPPVTALRWRRAIGGVHHVALGLLLALGWAGGGVDAQPTTAERVGDYVVVSLAATALTTTLVLKDRDGTVDFLLGAGVNAAVTGGLKRIFPKDRPDGSNRKSFPSGHTSTSFQAASFIHFRYGVEYGLPAYAAAAFVGYSRVQGRAHFVEDVAAGLVLGVVSSRIFTHRREDDDPDPEPRLGAGLQVRFGGGLGTSVGFGLLTLAR